MCSQNEALRLNLVSRCFVDREFSLLRAEYKRRIGRDLREQGEESGEGGGAMLTHAPRYIGIRCIIAIKLYPAVSIVSQDRQLSSSELAVSR